MGMENEVGGRLTCWSNFNQLIFSLMCFHNRSAGRGGSFEDLQMQDVRKQRLPRKPIDAKFTVLLWWIPILRLSASWAKPCTSRPPQTSSFRLASRHLRLRVPECRDALRCSRQFCSVYVLKGAQDDHRLRVLQCFTLRTSSTDSGRVFWLYGNIWQPLFATTFQHRALQEAWMKGVWDGSSQIWRRAPQFPGASSHHESLFYNWVVSISSSTEDRRQRSEDLFLPQVLCDFSCASVVKDRVATLCWLKLPASILVYSTASRLHIKHVKSSDVAAHSHAFTLQIRFSNMSRLH